MSDYLKKTADGAVFCFLTSRNCQEDYRISPVCIFSL
jgi:hypothetical protein